MRNKHWILICLIVFLLSLFSGENFSTSSIQAQSEIQTDTIQYYFRISPGNTKVIQLLNANEAVYKVTEEAIFTALTPSQTSALYNAFSTDEDILFEQIPEQNFDNPETYPLVDVTALHKVAASSQYNRKAEVTAIMIDDGYYTVLYPYLIRYITDVQHYFNNVSFQIYHPDFASFASPEAIRTFFQEKHLTDGINGVMIVGHLPFAEFKLPWGEPATFSLFYEDLDGIFIDENEDGYYDHRYWGPNVGIEMWTAWILPPTDNAQTYLTNYFDKTHEYYSQEDLLFKRGLLTINQNWCGAQNGALGDAFNYVYGENWDFLGCGEPTAAYLLDFVSLWESNNYQIQNIWAHSGHHGHYFDWDDSQPEGDYLPASTLGTLENGPQFSIVFACGGMQLGHPPEESLSTWYVMGDNNGMSAIGTTRSIGLPAQEYLVRSIRDSSSLAEGVFNYIDYHTSESYIRSIYPDEVNTFVWDILFVGNPYLFRHPDYDNFNFCPLIVK